MSESPFVAEHYDGRSDWLRNGRMNGIGASETAGLLGLSDYQSPYSLWVNKTETPEEREMDEIARWGLLLEPVICEELNRVLPDRRVDMATQYSIHRSKERKHVYFSPDAFTDRGEPCQLKTAHFAQAKIWRNKVPVSYMCQMQQEIYVSGTDHGYIAVLKDGYEFAWHKVDRNDRFIERMLAKIDFFWNEYVLKRQAPPLDYSEATTTALRRLYPRDDDTVIELSEEMSRWTQERDAISAEMSVKARRVDEIDNHIRAHIGFASYGRCLDGSGYSHKVNGKGTRTLRRVKKVGEQQ